eukprot:750241-Hanusia_phi.AAC.4
MDLASAMTSRIDRSRMLFFSRPIAFSNSPGRAGLQLQSSASPRPGFLCPPALRSAPETASEDGGRDSPGPPQGSCVLVPPRETPSAGDLSSCRSGAQRRDAGRRGRRRGRASTRTPKTASALFARDQHLSHIRMRRMKPTSLIVPTDGVSCLGIVRSPVAAKSPNCVSRTTRSDAAVLSGGT